MLPAPTVGGLNIPCENNAGLQHRLTRAVEVRDSESDDRPGGEERMEVVRRPVNLDDRVVGQPETGRAVLRATGARSTSLNKATVSLKRSVRTPTKSTLSTLISSSPSSAEPT